MADAVDLKSTGFIPCRFESGYGYLFWHLRQVVKSQALQAWVAGSNPVDVISFYSLKVEQLLRKQLMTVQFCLEAFL